MHDKHVRQHNLNTGADVGVLSVHKFRSAYIPPRTPISDPAERAVVLTMSSDNGLFELSHLAKDGNGSGEVRDSATEGGFSAIFVTRSRLAVLKKAGQASLPFTLFQKPSLTMKRLMLAYRDSRPL